MEPLNWSKSYSSLEKYIQNEPDTTDKYSEHKLNVVDSTSLTTMHDNEEMLPQIEIKIPRYKQALVGSKTITIYKIFVQIIK
jgi:hypothetical protein